MIRFRLDAADFQIISIFELTLLNCDQNWRSVRKVRYLEDIVTAIEYVIDNSGKQFDKKRLYERIIKSRYERTNLIQKHHQTSTRSKRSIYGTKFIYTTPDTLVFLKEMQIYSLDENNNIIKQELSKEYENNENIDLRLLILKYLLKSKYVAYSCYLKRLNDSEIIIPKSLQKRDTNTRKYLTSKKIFTDVPSFYTLRDIFYELNMNNWFVNESNELIIYPTYCLSKNPSNRYENNLPLDNDYINFNKIIEESIFVDVLVETYLDKSNRRYGLNLDLMSIRDKVCYNLGIGDFEFKQFIIKSSQAKSDYRVALNFGYKTSKLKNYDLKLITLPKVSSNRLAMYIKIEKVS